MRRGDLVTIALRGDFGKPRPALIVQSDHFDAQPTVTVLLVSSALGASPLLCVTIEPDERNGLRAPSQIMVDKAMTVMRGKVGPKFGRLGRDRMPEVERCLALFLGIAR
jgi:mRNA interferase MazF